MTPHFNASELACHCGCGMLPRIESAERLERLRVRCGFAFKVTSGARCSKHNQEVAETGANGPHTQGAAFDLEVSGGKALEVVDHARDEGFTGIGVKQHGPHEKRIIHLDDLPNAEGQPRPTIWSYP